MKQQIQYFKPWNFFNLVIRLYLQKIKEKLKKSRKGKSAKRERMLYVYKQHLKIYMGVSASTSIFIRKSPLKGSPNIKLVVKNLSTI